MAAALSVDELVRENLDFAVTIATRVKKRLPPFILLDDLIANANIGLWKAAQRYQGGPVPFRAYAYRAISGAVFDSVRRRNFKHTSTAQISEHSDAVEALQTDADEVGADLNDGEVSAEVRRILAALDPKARRIIELRYYKGLNGRDAGRELGLRPSRSSEVHREVLEHLRRQYGSRLEPLMKKTAPALAPPKVVDIEAARRSVIVDRLGALKARLAPILDKIGPEMREAERLREEIVEWTKDLGAVQGTSFSGKLYAADVTPCDDKRSITDMGRVFETLGKDTFLKHCSMTLKVAEVLLDKPTLAATVSKGPTGPRHVNTRLIEQDKKAA